MDLAGLLVRSFQGIVRGHAEKGDGFDFCKELAVLASIFFLGIIQWLLILASIVLLSLLPNAFQERSTQGNLEGPNPRPAG